MNRSTSEPNQKKVYTYVPLTVAIVFLVMWIFNLTFSLPTTYSEVVQNDMEKKGIERVIEQIQLRMNGDVDLEPFEFNPPVDDHVFLIDQPDQVNRLASEKVGLYAVRDGNRPRDSETSHNYVLHLRRFTDGSSLSYEVANSYSRDDSFSTYRVLDEENSLFLYIESLYE